MKKIKTKVVHSESKAAWNVVGTSWGDKYKIARIPYHVYLGDGNDTYNTICKAEALEHAQFISKCFNENGF